MRVSQPVADNYALATDKQTDGHTPNWPDTLPLLLLHPPGTLPADIQL